MICPLNTRNDAKKRKIFISQIQFKLFTPENPLESFSISNRRTLRHGSIVTGDNIFDHRFAVYGDVDLFVLLAGLSFRNMLIRLVGVPYMLNIDTAAISIRVQKKDMQYRPENYWLFLIKRMTEIAEKAPEL